jgi:alpha-galactosidase
MTDQRLDLSTSRMQLVFQSERGRLRLEQFGTGEDSWLQPGAAQGLFSVSVNGSQFNASNLNFEGAQELSKVEGIRHVVLRFSGQGIAVEQHLQVYEGTAVIELCPLVRNIGLSPCLIERIDSVSLNVQAKGADLFSFTGNWGSEFEPQQRALTEAVMLESRSGRSSKGNHPWFALSQAGRQVFSGAVAWSGNWAFRFEPGPAKSYHLSGGLHDWQFSKQLQTGETVDGAPVVLVLGGDLNAVSQQYARVGRKHWYPRNSFSSQAPVEWNHWWPYEDAEINEEVFARNVVKAEQMGFEVCTLDAGWFGPADAGTFWEHYRGDWHLVNEERFPHGLRSLADDVHARNMKFGIWCEIEGLGVNAQVAKDHPDYVALRDGQRLGYVCFGNPQVQDWAYGTLKRLITEYQADWIKVDFNLDPGAGCNRSDHGHQVGDGLYEHYQGYYRMLERIRRDFPEVVLENCSSGGLRIDLGMLRRTYMTFLSDPDWPVHDLQIFWGASTMLAPDVLLHWTYSDWRKPDPPPQHTFNPHDPNLTLKKWDYYTRISMLGLYGLSQKLPDLPEWLAQRVVEQNAIYKNEVRRFVLEADLYRLTSQPRRNGEGERWAAFQYSLPDASEHLLYVFRLPGAEQERAIRLQNLQPERVYRIQGLEGEWNQQATGRELMEEGLLFSRLEEEDSALLRVI